MLQVFTPRCLPPLLSCPSYWRKLKFKEHPCKAPTFCRGGTCSQALPAGGRGQAGLEEPPQCRAWTSLLAPSPGCPP